MSETYFSSRFKKLFYNSVLHVCLYGISFTFWDMMTKCEENLIKICKCCDINFDFSILYQSHKI
jgi:hypothetical protein